MGNVAILAAGSTTTLRSRFSRGGHRGAVDLLGWGRGDLQGSEVALEPLDLPLLLSQLVLALLESPAELSNLVLELLGPLEAAEELLALLLVEGDGTLVFGSENQPKAPSAQDAHGQPMKGRPEKVLSVDPIPNARTRAR